MPNWLLFLIPCCIWGSTWLVIKYQLGVVAPEVSVAYRFGAASLLLFAGCLWRREPLRFDPRTHLAFVVLGMAAVGKCLSVCRRVKQPSRTEVWPGRESVRCGRRCR